jgi:hypothetical protein
LYVRAGYVTFGKLAGVSDDDLIDHSAAAAQLPPLEYATSRILLCTTTCTRIIIRYRYRRDTELAGLPRTRH